ncbi:hypothetical protein KY285_023705 [Solanum tuberosum]|nr:hypothetical protein KY285_023705 [Solanum tuberosum]
MEPPKEKPSWLGMLKVNKTFEPDLDILQEQWTHPNNQVKRKWYVSSYTLKQRESFRDLWMKDMRRIGCEIEFFKWFGMTGRIENCAESLQVIINKWYTASNKVVESVTPPLEGINIPIAGTIIKASPFKEKSDKTGAILTTADIDRVVEQNNYSNQILHIISRQIEDTKPNLSGRPTPASTSSNHNIETYPGFKIPEFSNEKFPKLSDTFEVTGNIIEKINAQLNNFNISVKEDKTSKKLSTLHEETNLLQKLASSRFHNMKNYHDKPSFPDLQYEENAFLSTSSHEERSITEWNIDGLAEHQVYNKLHEMGVAITAYKMCGSADRDAASMIIAGFTGMLKHWWDNYCTDEIKQLIVNATATETVVKMEGNTPSTSTVTREDACATLLYHIAKHFIGEPKLFQDRSLQILNNLSCPNLDKFIHYKHAFLSKVMIRPDCNLDFWKERFISGLPPLFADKVRTKIQDRNNGNIPYGNLTYGDLVSTINIVALELCTDIKLKHQLKKEQSSSRKELGSFCRDFGFITPPDKIHKDNKEKSHRKKSRRRDDSTKPKKKKSRSKRPNDAKVDVCWTCGKTGHKANECRSKTKKKKINLLNIDEETKGKLLAILDEPFSESSGASDNYSDDEDIDLDYDSDASQSGKDCTCTEAFCTCDSTPQIRVLSDHSKEALFDVIQHINDNEARNRFLLELKNLLLNTDKPKTRPIVEPFSMKQIMNRSDKPSEPSISDLRHEVSSLKEEIKNIKSRLCIIETDVLTSHVTKGAAFHDLESNQGSSHEDLDNNTGIDPPNINNDHLVEPFVTNTGNNTSSSAAPGVTIKPYFTDLDGITATILGKDLHFPFVKTLSQDESWVPKQPGTKVQEKARTSSTKKLSKATLKQRLKEAMDNLDDYDENQIMKMIEDAASTESSSEDNGDIDDEDIDLDYDSDASQSGKDCTCTEAFCTCDSTPQIRVLSDHSKEALFDVIQHINDNEARNRFLLELKNLLLNTDKPKTRPIVEPFSMKQIMNRSDKPSEPSISDLRHEVSSLKEEIKNIKSRLCIIETDVLTSHVTKGAAFHDLESNQGSSHEDLDNNTGIDPPNINNDHLVEPFVTNTGNNTSSSAAPGVTISFLEYLLSLR